MLLGLVMLFKRMNLDRIYGHAAFQDSFSLLSLGDFQLFPPFFAAPPLMLPTPTRYFSESFQDEALSHRIFHADSSKQDIQDGGSHLNDCSIWNSTLPSSQA